MNSFGDLSPRTSGVYFKDMSPREGGETSANGDITVASRFAQISCFTFEQYEEVFGVLFHEMMHSTDNAITVLHEGFGDQKTRNHSRIYDRGAYELLRSFTGRNDIPRGDLWGNPGNKPVDIRKMYEKYRSRTKACKC